MAAPLDKIFQRGFRFTLSPREVVTYYLPRLIAGAPLHEAIRPVIHHADVYACEPGVLAGQFRPASSKTDDRFFFTTCRRQQPRAAKDIRYVRVAGPGSWTSQRTIDIKDRADVKVGEVRKLRYKKGKEYTDWLMEEYSCSCCLKEAVVGDTERVLCRIYPSPNAAPDSAARQESAAVLAQPAPEDPIVAQAAPKRLAPQVDAEPPCPKRIRGAIVPTLPVVKPAGYTTSFEPPRPCVPHRGMPPSSTPSVTGSPASALPPAPVRPRPVVQPGRLPASASPRPCARPQQQVPLPTVSVVRACHMPQQAPAAQAQLFMPRPPPAACSPGPVAEPDLPSTEAPGAAHDDEAFADSLLDIPTDGAEEEADDMDQFVSTLNDSLDSLEETAASSEGSTTTEAPAMADDLIAFADSLVDIITTGGAEEKAAARSEVATTTEADDDMDQFVCSLNDSLDVVEEVHEELDPFAAAIAREAKFMCA